MRMTVFVIELDRAVGLRARVVLWLGKIWLLGSEFHLSATKNSTYLFRATSC